MFGICHHGWEGVIMVGKISQGLGRYQHSWEGFTKVGKMSQWLGRHQPSWESAIMVGKISQRLGRYYNGKAWVIILNLSQCTQCLFHKVYCKGLDAYTTEICRKKWDQMKGSCIVYLNSWFTRKIWDEGTLFIRHSRDNEQPLEDTIEVVYIFNIHQFSHKSHVFIYLLYNAMHK